jgi:peptidoglycan/xylan/chitin deacetylase (PgdA/CDA1 family)
LPVVNPYDFARPGEAELTRRVLSAARPDAVVLLHAGVRETRQTLPALIASLRRRGFAFGVLR